MENPNLPSKCNFGKFNIFAKISSKTQICQICREGCLKNGFFRVFDNIAIFCKKSKITFIKSKFAKFAVKFAEPPESKFAEGYIYLKIYIYPLGGKFDLAFARPRQVRN